MVDAAIGFVLDRAEITGLATVGDTGLLPLVIESQRRRESGDGQSAVDLDSIPDTGSLFEHSPGRVVPDWLAHLIPSND